MIQAFLNQTVMLIAMGTILLHAHYFRMLFPYPGAVLEEGKTYTIRWETDREGPLCITALIGGHERDPNMGDCRIEARSGSYPWHIFRGFVGNYGLKRSDDVWLGFTDPRTGEIFYRSEPFSVVVKREHHPIPYPIRFPHRHWFPRRDRNESSFHSPVLQESIPIFPENRASRDFLRLYEDLLSPRH